MPAYLLLIVAVCSRLIPHAGLWNFTAVGGSLIFFGARRSRREMIAPLAALMATDVILTVFTYHMSFRLVDYVATWGWYLGAIFLGRTLLSAKSSFGRVAAATLAGSTSFFIISNFMVWLSSGMYPLSSDGLVACYVAAIPFYRNDVISTSLVAAVAFGLPALVRRFAPSTEATVAVR